MYEFWYDHVKPKYRDKAKLCYIDTYSFIVIIEIEDTYADTTKDIKTRFDVSNYELDRALPKRKSKKVTGLMKDELGGKIIEFTTLRPKTYSSLTDDNDKINCLEATQVEHKIILILEVHKEFAEKKSILK